MDFSDQIKSIMNPEMDKTFLAAFMVITGTNIKYDFPSLKRLEYCINIVYKPGHKPQPATLIMVGMYLGETIRRNVGGEWLPEAPDAWNLILRHPTKKGVVAYVKPLLRANYFWDDREKFSLTGMYKNAEFQLNYDITDREAMNKLKDEEGWITMSDGYMLRYTEQPTDDEEENKFLNKFLNK